MRPCDFLTITGTEAAQLHLTQDCVRAVADTRGLGWYLHYRAGVRWRWWR